MGSDTQVYFNVRNRRAGYLFQGRYRAFLVDEEAFFLGLIRYILPESGEGQGWQRGSGTTDGRVTASTLPIDRSGLRPRKFWEGSERSEGSRAAIGRHF
jgi:hypothetical protein